MITYKVYVNQDLEHVLNVTGLASDELESIVGRFRYGHYARPGQLKGELIQYIDGSCELRHSFTKKVLWKSEIY